MGKQYNHIPEKWQNFIKAQKMFFVSTATSDGRVNLSPKGLDTFRILNQNKIAWLNLTGSGNETAAHLLENDRITIMFCAFEGDPAILRLYGHAKIYHKGDKEWEEMISLFPDFNGIRQLMVVEVNLFQKSCGYAVPYYDYKGQRDILPKWIDKQGDQGIKIYQEKNNKRSLDGKETDI